MSGYGQVGNGSWPCKNALSREVGEKPGPVRSQATIAAIASLVPTMFMTRVRLQARTETLDCERIEAVTKTQGPPTSTRSDCVV